MKLYSARVPLPGAAAVLLCLLSLAACASPPRAPGEAETVIIIEEKTPSVSRETGDAVPEAPAVPGMVFLPGGVFSQGSSREDDAAVHEVTLSPFYLASHEVTQEEYEELMGVNPSFFTPASPEERLPVENVSWFDAVAYCNARSLREGLSAAYVIDGDTVVWDRTAGGYRLPTEAEWEYACRAGAEAGADDGITSGAANFEGKQTAPVGSFPPNAWGLYDMRGNVWEWCWDWYGPYPAGPTSDPAGPAAGDARVNRGGGWQSRAGSLRAAFRFQDSPSQRTSSLGFRIAR